MIKAKNEHTSRKFWTYEKRIELQNLLRQGYNVSQIKGIWDKTFGVSPSLPYIRNEVKAGLTEEDYKDKLYVKYDIGLVYKNMLGEDAIKFIKSM